MFKIPLDKIIEAIKEKANLSEEEINKKIDEKLVQLSGLVSKEGAGHIIANELGIKLFEAPKGSLQIKNILSGMRNVETVGRVIQKFDLREFKTENREGKMSSFIIGDETGSIRTVIWGEKADMINNLKENDILKIRSGYAKDNQGRLEIHLNDKSEIMLNPIGENLPLLVPKETARKSIKDLSENESNVEVLGTIVQVYDPRFYEVCPDCKRKAIIKDGAFFCNSHGKINISYSYVLNLFLDDGTENIRTVFFGNQVEQLLKRPYNEIVRFKDSMEEFTYIKNELLGTQIKVNGRVNKNQMFDRLEFVAQKVTIPNPEEELKRLEKETM